MDQVPFETIKDGMVEFDLNAAVIQLQVWNVARNNRECVRVRIHLHKLCFFLVIVIEFVMEMELLELLVVLFIVVLEIKIESLKLLWGGAPTFASLSMCLLQAFEISLKM